MKKSIIASAVTAVLGFMSVGDLGERLADLVWPVVYTPAGNPRGWRGDDVWPALMGADVWWGEGGAGHTDGILWATAVIIWTFMTLTLEFR